MSDTQKIAMLMEQIPIVGAEEGSMDTGGVDPNAGEVVAGPDSMMGDVEVGDDQGFDPQQISAAKEFVSLVGDTERARELIDKVDDAMEALDGGSGNTDAETIDMVASLIPDVPMQGGVANITPMYDPGFGG